MHRVEFILQPNVKPYEKQLTQIVDEISEEQARIFPTIYLRNVAGLTSCAADRKPKQDAIAQPHRRDSQRQAPMLTCPICVTAMRIWTIELRDGRELITLVCDECKRQAILDNPS